REKTPMTVGWWIPAGTIPTLAEALERLEMLRANGPSADAFPLTRTIPDPPTTTTQEAPAMGQVFIPYLTVGDSRAALQFYAEVFGAVRTGELFEMDDGRIGHAEMTIGDQLIYLADEFSEMNLASPAAQGSNSVSIVIHVDDCDAVYAHAVQAGATGERPPADQHGFRSGWFVDPWGHRWSPTSAMTGG
ncbi:MAG: VOC family protein, partial [Actinomycetota bacterium]